MSWCLPSVQPRFCGGWSNRYNAGGAIVKLVSVITRRLGKLAIHG